MADTFQLQVATPEQLLVDEQVSEVQVPRKNGYLGILAGHAPLLSALGSGTLTYEGGGGPHVLAVSGGFVEVFDNNVRVLADQARERDAIDVEAARRDVSEGTQEMRGADSEQASSAALDRVSRGQAFLDTAGQR
jgi:F-type H+-transporting ATPase subunit epsilon